MAQSQNSYEDRWSKVEDLELKNNIEDAQKIVQKIYRKARRKDNHPQIIKAFLYTSKFKLINEEDALVNIQADLVELIEQAAFPEKNLYHFIYAKMLWRYQTENYRRLQSLNESMNEPEPDNFLTWPRDYLNDKIAFHFDQALTNPDQLALIYTDEYQAVVTETIAEFNLFEPTLLDLIAQDAIEFQKSLKVNRLEDVTTDVAMQIGYMNTSEINNLTWKSDWDSNVFKVIQLHVMLENAHLKKPQNVPAYIKYINDRFLYIKRQYSGYTSAANYRSSANALITRFKKIPDHTLVSYHLAKHHLSLSPLKNDYRIYSVERDSSGVDQQITQSKHRARAIELAQQATQLFPESYGAQLSKDLLKKIKQPYLKLEYNSNIAPDSPQRVSLTYRNLDKARIYFFKINFLDAIELDDSLNRVLFNRSKALNDFATVKEIELPDAADTFKREREILLPGLSEGNYLVTLEYESESGINHEIEILRVSNLGVFTGTHNNQKRFQVLDKKTGFPVSEANVLLHEDDLDQYTTLSTDKLGLAVVTMDSLTTYDDEILISKGQDSVFVDDYQNRYYSSDVDDDEELSKTVKTFVYLDRGIYRPGQEVFFKVINVVLENGKKSIVPGEKFNFYVTAPNNKEIYDAYFTSNEYGSFHGSFTLPEEVLQGEFTIEVDSDEETAFWDEVEDFNDYDVVKTFKVEEYKRPRFEVVFDNDDRDYLVQDSVRIKATAAAFLGAAISDAQISYTINRKTFVPWWEYSGYYDEEQIIKQVTFEKDSLTTNAQGEIILDFVTEVDPYVLEKYPNASRSYEIEIKLTDSNGETVIETTSINAVKDSYRLVINNPDRMTLKNRSLQFYLENLEKQKLPAQVELQVFKTDFNARPNTEEISTLVNSEFTERQWDSIFSESMYYQMFIKNIPDSLVYSKVIDLKDVYKLDLPLDKSWSNGYYKIKLTTIPDSDQAGIGSELVNITAQKTVQIWTDPLRPLTTTVISHTHEIINGQVHLNLYTSVDSVYVNLYASSNGTQLYEKQLKVLNGRNTYVLDYNPIPGSTTNFYYSLIHENRGLNASLTVQRERIKESDYSIKTTTFRDKLRPGIEEKWSFHIEDDQGSPFAAEFLASMYDQSLDTFACNEWKPFSFDDNEDYYRYRTPSNYLTLKNDESYRNIYLSVPLKFQSRMTLSTKQWNFHGFLDALDSYDYREYLNKLRLERKRKYDFDGTISGTVTDPSGEPVFGATIQIANTQEFTTTDFDGNFALESKLGDVIIVSYTGYDSFRFTLNNLSYIPVQLRTSLDEVVVSAYSTAVSIEEVVAKPNASPVQKLIGQIPGIQAGLAQQSTTAPSLPDSYKIPENNEEPLYFFKNQLISKKLFDLLSSSEIKKITYLEANEAMNKYGNAGSNGAVFIEPVAGFTYQDLLSLSELGQIVARKNLNETAFFIPDLYTDDKGNISFSFTSPEMLTRWQFQLLGHNKDAVVAYLDKKVVTQKDLSLVPNPPRFVRELDTLVFSSKIINLSKNDVQAIANIEFYDTRTNEKLSLFTSKDPSLKKVSIAKNKSVSVAWKIAIPENRTSITYKIKASAGNFTDGEENTLPVLSNKILITESTSMWVPAGEERSMKLEALNKSVSSPAQPLLLSMDYTTNAGWSALESLPYLMDYQHECAEQVFSKYYANAVAAHTITQHPELLEMFKVWSNKTTTSVAMNKRNDGLIKENMPWAFDLQQKEQQLKRFAQHFDSVKIQQEQLKFINRLDYLQMDSGMFPWFQGGKANPFITTHIVTGLGAMQRSGVLSEADFYDEMYNKALVALDKHWLEQFKEFQKEKNINELNFADAYWQYAYARSFKKTLITTDTVSLLSVFRNTAFAKAEKDYASQNNYTKLLIAITAHRNGEKELAKNILEGLKQTAVKSELYGMYWKSDNQRYRSHNDTETQALAIQAFIEINKDYDTARLLQMWMLYKKSKSYWTSTKTTTQAIQAILAVNSGFKDQMNDHRVRWGTNNLDQVSGIEIVKEPTIRLITATAQKENITTDLAEVTIKNRSNDSGFASMQYQYLQPVDQIAAAGNKDLTIKKVLFRKATVNNEIEWLPIIPTDVLRLGDIIKVKLQITTTNDQSYVHVKDLRASGFEPLATTSGHRYTGDALYYETTKDASKHYYFERLNKGIHVLEYDLVVNNLGSYSTGVATVESMYAPELNAHSNSERIMIAD
jgi:uncharacterized protein YfaS (alpha-2-macroglobulin family)